jgi:hypothetical protein
MNIPMVSQKSLVIVGATGMAGGYALRYALDFSPVSRAALLSNERRSQQKAAERFSVPLAIVTDAIQK